MRPEACEDGSSSIPRVHSVRGWLGVRIQDVTPDVAEAMGLKDVKGALVTDVPKGPAMDAGIKAGDVITSFDGTEVADTRHLVRRVADTEIGKAVPIVVLRDRQRHLMEAGGVDAAHRHTPRDRRLGRQPVVAAVGLRGAELEAQSLLALPQVGKVQCARPRRLNRGGSSVLPW